MRLHNYLLLLLFVSLTSCQKGELGDVALQSPAKTYDLVIEGEINTSQKTQFIRLTEPIFDDRGIIRPVRGAQVSVNDSEKEIPFKETAIAGLYSGVVNNNTNYNKAYTLTVKYNQKQYTATDTLRQVLNIIDDFLPLSARYIANGDVELHIPKHTFGFLNSCKWLISYPGAAPWNPSLFDGSQYYTYTHTLGSPNAIYPLITQTRKIALHPNDFVTIYKFSLSENYARYLYSAFLETDWKGIFSSVPGKITGNISGDAVGFFYVTDVDVRRYPLKDLVN